jgi:hypothetical protein
VAIGSEFELRAFVQDVRASDGDANPRDDRGVFAGYFDLLYNSDLVSVLSDANNPLGFEIDFADAYENGISGDTETPNLIDEAGAFQTGSRPLGPAEQLLFTIRLRANAAGTVNFQADPADIPPLHDSLLFQPTEPVTLSQIDFGGVSITEVGASPEGEGLTNPANALDVNNDGFVSPIDPLIVVNYLNRGDLEAESTTMYVDVTGDGHVSPIDALTLVNYLNNAQSADREGEGEGSHSDLSVMKEFGVDSIAISHSAAVAEADQAGPAAVMPVWSGSTTSDSQRAWRPEAVSAEWSWNDPDSESDELDELISDLALDVLNGWKE